MIIFQLAKGYLILTDAVSRFSFHPMVVEMMLSVSEGQINCMRLAKETSKETVETLKLG